MLIISSIGACTPFIFFNFILLVKFFILVLNQLFPKHFLIKFLTIPLNSNLKKTLKNPMQNFRTLGNPFWEKSNPKRIRVPVPFSLVHLLPWS